MTHGLRTGRDHAHQIVRGIRAVAHNETVTIAGVRRRSTERTASVGVAAAASEPCCVDRPSHRAIASLIAQTQRCRIDIYILRARARRGRGRD
jgi:hypothetical protein